MGKNQKLPNTYKTERRAIMIEDTRNQLEVKLKKMLHRLDQAKGNQKQSISEPGTGNIIRRRKGEKDKRFSIYIEPKLHASLAE